jgi:hypothetical protein
MESRRARSGQLRSIERRLPKAGDVSETSSRYGTPPPLGRVRGSRSVGGQAPQYPHDRPRHKPRRCYKPPPPRHAGPPALKNVKDPDKVPDGFITETAPLTECQRVTCLTDRYGPVRVSPSLTVRRGRPAGVRELLPCRKPPLSPWNPARPGGRVTEGRRAAGRAFNREQGGSRFGRNRYIGQTPRHGPDVGRGMHGEE